MILLVQRSVEEASFGCEYLIGRRSTSITKVGLAIALQNILLSFANTFLAHNTLEMSIFQPHRFNMICDILINLPVYLKLLLLDMTCASIFTSTSASCITSLNLHFRYFVLVLLNESFRLQALSPIFQLIINSITCLVNQYYVICEQHTPKHFPLNMSRQLLILWADPWCHLFTS